MADHGLVIGINHYPEFRPLQGAITDATAVAKWLRSPQGGNLGNNCVLVTSKATPLEPLHDMVDRELRAILDGVNGQGDRFYFYFSGHGLAQEQDAADLCLPNWSEIYRNYALDSSNYIDTVLDSGLFREVAFFLDCCRLRRPRARGLPCGFTYPAPQSGSRKFVAHATEVFTSAYEDIDDELVEGNEVYRGHFTKALLQALSGAAVTAPGGVAANDLKSYIENNTVRIAQAHGHTQKPVVTNGLEGNPRFGNATPTAPGQTVSVTIEFTAGRLGPIALLDPKADELKNDAVGSGPWNLPLGEGLHQLIDWGNKARKPFRISPSMGDQHVSF